ncbi:hypothetical protein [Cyclobacterium plantarum]|uniref:hypothetical protein n=1 Tax=Cyclobacterium plantarum TaxID=2716263 RepID=UPI003F72E7BF
MKVVDPPEMNEGPDPGFFPASGPRGFGEEKIFKKREKGITRKPIGDAAGKNQKVNLAGARKPKGNPFRS